MSATEWIQNGLSNDIISCGDASCGDFACGDPAPVFNSECIITNWTTTSLEPEG
jgi:hypothetical protein